MRADLHISNSGNTLALEFYPADKKDKWNLTPKKNSWESLLDDLNEALPRPMGSSQILLEGLDYAVSEYSIIVIKRNEKRFWTRSLAREDAESTLCKRMVDTMPLAGGIE